VVAVSRCIPILRSGPIYAAGVARMSFGWFVSMATLGSIVWIGALALIGKHVGHDWNKLRDHLKYVDYAAVVVIVVLVLWVIYRYVQKRRNRAVTVATDVKRP
jgi:membrane protein DedA with SNARE-associated domain